MRSILAQQRLHYRVSIFLVHIIIHVTIILLVRQSRVSLPIKFKKSMKGKSRAYFNLTDQAGEMISEACAWTLIVVEQRKMWERSHFLWSHEEFGKWIYANPPPLHIFPRDTTTETIELPWLMMCREIRFIRVVKAGRSNRTWKMKFPTTKKFPRGCWISIFLQFVNSATTIDQGERSQAATKHNLSVFSSHWRITRPAKFPGISHPPLT